MGRNSSVGTATQYGLDGPGIECQWRGKFYAPVPGDHPAFCTTCIGFLVWGVKRPGHGVNHLPPSSAKIKERVEL